MKENRKRVLSLLLVLVMLVGLFPSSAFADDTVKVQLASNAPGAKVTVYERTSTAKPTRSSAAGTGITISSRARITMLPKRMATRTWR